MPIKMNILDNGAGIEFFSYETVTGKEIIEANEKIYTPEYLAKLKYQIIDRSMCTKYLVSSEEMEIIAGQEIRASKINNNITIVLVSTTDLQYGMSRMWQALSEETGFKSEIFNDRASADKYIKETFQNIQPIRDTP